LDTKIDSQLLKDQITAFAHTSGPRFTKRIVLNRWYLGRPYFEEVPFDINNHLSFTSLPNGSTEDDLMDLMGEVVSKPLDFRFALWHVTAVDYNDQTVLMWRMHHALADGQGFTRANINFLGALDPSTGQHTGKAVDMSQMQFKAGRAAKRRNSIALAAETIGTRLRNLVQRLMVVVVGIGVLLWSTISLLFINTPVTGRKSMLGATSRKRQGFVEKQVAWSNQVTLSQVKECKDILGCTVNDVLTATLIGALEKYLESRGQLKDPALSFLVPTSMRKATDHKASNESSGFMVSLPVGLGSSLARVRSFNQRMSLLKKSFEPSVYYHGGGSLVLPWTVPSALLEYGGFKVHGVISNVRVSCLS
jgi:diacylglycerol O-acyltransferase